MIEVICGGIIIADTVVRPIGRLPARGTLGLVDSIDLCLGGCASNTGAGLARLGVRTAVVGRVGDDNYGKFLRDALAREGLDTSAVRADKKNATSCTAAFVSADGERTFIHTIGANAALTDRDFPLARFSGARLVHCAGILLNPGMKGAPLARLLRRARKLGLATSVDTVYDARGHWLSFVEESLPFTDIFFTNETEGAHIAGRRDPAGIAEFLLGRGVGTAVVKRGEKGSLIKTRDARIEARAYKVRCVDTTGAGDAYVAGFLYGFLKGWPLEKCGKFASATGAISTTAPGATAALPALRRTLNALKEWDPEFFRV